jgi:hypothetical protein
MVCRLCLENSDLKNSHIIPEAFFKSVYGKKHRTFPITMEDKKLRFIQKGITEKLLCGSCEQKFSKWETILKKSLIAIADKQSQSLNFTFFNQYHDLFKVENIKYKEFKLGALSILWRMSIASDDFFRSYDLGSYYQERLRQILLNEDLVDEKKYPMLVTRYESNGIFHPGIILSFPPDRYETLIVQSFAIWGHRFSIFVNDKRFPKMPVDACLRESGQLYISVDSLINLVSSNNIFSRLYDEKVNDMFAKLK